MSVNSVLTGVICASFFWGLFFAALLAEYSVPSNLGPDFTVKENPVTQNRRVVDNVSGTTVFCLPGNPPLTVVEVQRVGENRWRATFEKPYH